MENKLIGLSLLALNWLQNDWEGKQDIPQIQQLTDDNISNSQSILFSPPWHAFLMMHGSVHLASILERFMYVQSSCAFERLSLDPAHNSIGIWISTNEHLVIFKSELGDIQDSLFWKTFYIRLIVKNMHAYPGNWEYQFHGENAEIWRAVISWARTSFIKPS